MKKCSKCKENKELGQFSKRSRSKDGLKSCCKVCDNLRNANRYKSNREEILVKQAKYSEENKEKISIRKAAYYSENKEHISAVHADYRQSHKEEIAAYFEENREKISIQRSSHRNSLSAEEKEEIVSYQLSYRKENKEEISDQRASYRANLSDEEKEQKIKYMLFYYKTNKVQLSIKKAIWAKENMGKIIASCNKRRAAKLQRTPKWLTEEQFKEIENFYCIANELQWLSENPLVVDHIVPLQGKNVSGLHVPENLQIVTASMNSSKKNKFNSIEYNKIYLKQLTETVNGK